jgi:hypothetical protein
MSLEQFYIEEKPTWGTEKENEIRLRIKLCVAAYAYEVENDSIMSDHEFDEKCKSVNLNVSTGNRKLDNWFKKNFDPSRNSISRGGRRFLRPPPDSIETQDADQRVERRNELGAFGDVRDRIQHRRQVEHGSQHDPNQTCDIREDHCCRSNEQ